MCGAISLVRMPTGILWCVQDCIRASRHDITPCMDILFVDVDDCMWRIGDSLEPPMACVAELEFPHALLLQFGADSSVEDNTLLAGKLAQYLFVGVAKLLVHGLHPSAIRLLRHAGWTEQRAGGCNVGNPYRDTN